MKRLPLLFVVSLSSCVIDSGQPLSPSAPNAPVVSPAPADWNAWANWVEARQASGDGQGHGPDVGSDEWAYAIDRQLGITDSQGHGPDFKSAEWRRAVESRLGR